MLNQPLVTVYITNYNYGNYIEQAIQSVLNQTLKDFELIIIDDGSTDHSKDIIETYASNPKISIIYQKNKGLNITNNVALKAAKGKYIVRLDADDYFEKNALKEMSDILENKPEIGLVFPNYYIVDASNNIVSEIKRHDFDNEVTILDQPAHGACTMIRVKSMKKVGGYDESYTCQDGYELWVKFISKFKVTNINKTLFSYRRHNNNLTNNEDRILGTRSRIKDAFVKKESLQLPKVAAIIALRPNYDIALEDFNGTSYLEHKINILRESKNIDKVVVTSSDRSLQSFVKEKYGNRVIFIERPTKIERINISLFETLDYFYNTNEVLDGYQSVLFSSLNYPFVTSEIINDAVNTLSIFKADSLISVRPEGNKFFRHTGQGMRTILEQDKFTKLERESLYKYSGGILLANIKSAIEQKSIVHGNVGHIVIGEKAAVNIESAFDRKIANYLLQKEKLE